MDCPLCRRHERGLVRGSSGGMSLGERGGDRDHGSSMTYISTDAVYRGSDGNYDEGSPADPVNVYGRSKLAGENAVREVLGDPLILRTNIFGWNLQPKHSIAEWFLSGLEAGKRVPGFTDVLFSPLLV